MKQTFYKPVILIVMIMMASVSYATDSYGETTENEAAYSRSYQTDNDGTQNRGHRRPPPEAYSACEGKNAGDTAEFVSPRGDTVTGTCEQERDGDQLVLRPDHPPEGRGRRGERQNQQDSYKNPYED